MEYKGTRTYSSVCSSRCSFFSATHTIVPLLGVFCLTRLYYVAGSYTRTYIYIRNRTTFVSLTNCSSVWRNGSTFSCPRKHEARESRRHGHNSCRYVFFSFPSPLFSSHPLRSSSSHYSVWLDLLSWRSYPHATQRKRRRVEVHRG